MAVVRFHAESYRRRSEDPWYKRTDPDSPQPLLCSPWVSALRTSSFVLLMAPNRNSLRGKGLGDTGRREWESGRKGTVPVSRLEGRLTVCVNSQTRQTNVPRTGKHILGRGWLLRQVCTLTEISSLRLTLENHPRSWRNPGTALELAHREHAVPALTVVPHTAVF